MSEAPLTVLVVDDEPSNIDVLKGALSAAYTVKAAVSGEKALQVARKEPHPDLVLLDVMMPGVDGYEVCRRLKGDPATAGIPVVFVSGHSTEAERQEGLACGAADFISKPVEPEGVLATVRRVIAARP